MPVPGQPHGTRRVLWCGQQETPEEAEERGYRLYLCYTIECGQEDLKGSYFPHLSFAGKYYPLATYEMGKLEHLQKYL